jgi:hypothetical protein
MMGTASPHFDRWSWAGRELWRQVFLRLGQKFRLRFAPSCGHLDCLNTKGPWRRLRYQPRGVLIQGLLYCADGCTERALTGALRRLSSASQRASAPHRVPLGLLLLSRQQLTPHQLSTVLEAQRRAGRGRIGEWFLALGFANEQQVTAALARQWSCPVLRASFLAAGTATERRGRGPQIPLNLLEAFAMIPVDYVETTATLHVAFGEGIDYGVLYAIEQMLGCRTEFCMAVPSLVRQRLQAMSGPRAETEVLFDRVTDAAEFSRIVCSYCVRLSATEIRLSACGPHLWVRLLIPSRAPLDLLFRSLQPASSQSSAHGSASLASTLRPAV